MSYFTYAAAIDLLSQLDQKYGIFPLRDWRGRPGIILRHDVDLDIEPAYGLSRHELEAGLRASYFVLVSAGTYNCQSKANRMMLRRMADDGFEIALHFDPSIYEETEEVLLERRARAEARVLEDIVGNPVNSVSLHNPTIAGYPLLPGWTNAYDPAIFSPSVYLSDSRMEFRHDPRTFFAEAGKRTHQLLLHPMHYGEVEPRYPAAKLAYVRRLVAALHETFSANSTYRREVGERLIDLLAEDIRTWGR